MVKVVATACAVMVFLFPGVSTSFAASPQFTDVSVAAGVDVTNGVIGFFDHHDYTGGGAVGDFNNDGWQDLFVISGGTGAIRDYLFINNGDGTFSDRAEQWKLDFFHLGKGASVADYNGDGHLDLYITSAGTFGKLGPGHHKLYRNNGDGSFTNVAFSAKVNATTLYEYGEDGFGSTWGDYDLDGDLDLVVAGFASNNGGTHLYRNNGDETFTDMTAAINLFGGSPATHYGFTPRLVDMDGDFYPELLLVADYGTSLYFKNNGDGTFTDLTVAGGAGKEENGMGGTVGDFNADGLLDWYVTSIYNPGNNWTGNKLYYNQGNHVYTENATALGVDLGGYGWGTVAVDFNHDGRLDIAETNGGTSQSGSYSNMQSNLWIQEPNGTFTEQALTAGMSHFDRGRGMVNFDYDNDGDQDVVIFSYGDQLRLFRNDTTGPDTNWIRIFLDTQDAPGLAPGGTGARVKITSGGSTQMRVMTSGDNFLSHSELSAHFGLGNSSTVTTLLVEWPDGSTTTLSNVTANRTLTIKAGAREQACTDSIDNDGDNLIDCNDPDCCGLTGCQSGEGICCASAGECNDGQFCNGVEECIDDLCASGPAPCAGQECNEIGATCVQCMTDDDCYDALFCTTDVCSGNVCVAGPDPCPGQQCDDGSNSCVDCLIDTDCTDDGQFCNGTEKCFAGQCQSFRDVCVGQGCDEGSDSCIGSVALQPRLGQPILGLTEEQLERFEAGRQAFEATLSEPAGLGPIYNADRCSSCHGPAGGSVTQFGQDDNQGGVTPLPGGPVLQTLAISGVCGETLPVQADVQTLRTPPLVAGAGLVEALDEGFLIGSFNTGTPRLVEVLEEPGEAGIGRFGWKSRASTVRTLVSREAQEQLGLSNRLLPLDTAPNGDLGLLATCDSVADPEDTPDLAGFDLVDRLTDYVRYLAQPPQTPKIGMAGFNLMTSTGCADCHESFFFTAPNPLREPAFYLQFIYPYSDFRIHDMGDNGDPMGAGLALPGWTRTAPLWGLRARTTLWHDGRFSGGTFESRVLAAIAAHDVPGSEGAAAAQAFAALPPADQDSIVAFLDSMGRAEFDHDGDNDVDTADYAQFNLCFTGPGSFYTPDDTCSISDIDADGDVDDDDRVMFEIAADGPAGRVPDLALSVLGGGQVRLSWGASCGVGDLDYAVYEGALGSFSSHASVTCTTAGSTTHDWVPGNGSRYFLVVPNTQFREGSYGRSSDQVEREPGAGACLPQAIEDCP